MKKKIKKYRLRNKLVRGLNWLNGFSFRFFVVFLGGPIMLIIGAISLFIMACISITWIFLGSTKSIEELREKTSKS